MESVIHFREVVKQYPGTLALDSLTLSIPAGRLVGFLGPNGAGKTTSFRALLGLTRVSSGAIEVLGLSVGKDTPAIVKRVGAVVEEPGLYKTLNAIDNMRVAADVLGRGHSEIGALLDFVELTEAAKRKVDQYSKGMRQRLALATAMIGDPEVLILDEPLDGLDPAGQVVLKRQLQDLVADRGKSVIVSSHDLADVEQLAQHVIVIDRGRLVTAGALGDIIGHDSRHTVLVADPAGGQAALKGVGIESTISGSELIVDESDGAMISRVLAGAGIYPSMLVPKRTSLESVFLSLTRRGDSS